MNKNVFFILGFLFVFSVSSLIIGTYLNSTAAFTISGASATLLAGFFAVGVLDYKIGGSQITLEKRVDTLEHKNTDLQRAVTVLLKASYILSDASGRLGGRSVAREQLVVDYLTLISDLLDPDALAEVRAEISKLNKE